MSIKVLLADGNKVILSAMRRVLELEPRIKIVGELSSFDATIQLIGDVKPDILLLDLHLPDKTLSAEFVKSRLAPVPCTLAVALSDDSETKDLALSYGAAALLDKMKLYNDMIPAILGCWNLRFQRRNASRLLFLPGFVFDRTFLAFSISRAVQSRTFTVPTVTSFGASMVPAAMCRCRVTTVQPTFLAASRVENFFML